MIRKLRYSRVLLVSLTLLLSAVCFQNCSAFYSFKTDSIDFSSEAFRSQAKQLCAQKKYVFLTNPDLVHFSATKNLTTTPTEVPGTIAFYGLAAGASRVLFDAEIELKFDLFTISTGVDLRNERIRNIVFGALQSPYMTFKSQSIDWQGLTETDLLPDTPFNFIVKGELTILGTRHPLDIPLTGEWIGKQVHVTSMPGFKIDFHQQLGLQNELATLVALVSTTMDPLVSFSFDFYMEDICNP